MIEGAGRRCRLTGVSDSWLGWVVTVRDTPDPPGAATVTTLSKGQNAQLPTPDIVVSVEVGAAVDPGAEVGLRVGAAEQGARVGAKAQPHLLEALVADDAGVVGRLAQAVAADDAAERGERETAAALAVSSPPRSACAS